MPRVSSSGSTPRWAPEGLRAEAAPRRRASRCCPRPRSCCRRACCPAVWGRRRAAEDAAPPPDGPPRADRRAPPDRLSLLRRVALFDAEGRQFAGAPLVLDRGTALPVMVDARAVAYVDLAPLRLPAEQGERAFLREQWRDALLVGAAALLLSAAVSMGFARHLKRPVRQLVEGTRALTQGQLDTRLPAERRDEFGLLAVHFNQMAHQLQQQERGRREWLASTAHELRTPLAVLRALIEAQQEGIRQGDAATLQCLHDQVMNLSRLVDDLHELARHDAGSVRLQCQPLHPKALLEGVLASQRERLAEAGLSPCLHDHSGDALIHADPQRLSQLFHNLVENSCRYTDAPGRLDITLRLIDQPGLRGAPAPTRQWQADFDDSPPGLAEADHPRLFERFFRAEASRSRATGGSGLGLSICRAIAEEHGGQIEAMASPLGGLRVRLVLPVSAAPVPPRAS